MFLIAKNKYRFNFPVSLQRSHLLDVWHLDKAHWFTLCGVKVGKVLIKNPSVVVFDLHRFGKVNRVEIEQTEDSTVVTTGHSSLLFKIEQTDKDYHLLHVSLFSNLRSLILLWPLIQLVFWLTVVEDYVYYGKHSK